MGRVGSGLEFYDPNETRPAIKKNFVTQPNPASPKNRPNPAGCVGWVGSVLVLGAHSYVSPTLTPKK